MRAKLRSGTAALACAAAIACSAGAAGAGSPGLTYRGHGETDRQMTVRASLDTSTHPPRVEFKASGVRLYCDDGSRFRYSPPVERTRVYDHTFRVEHDYINPMSGAERYYYAKGTFDRSGRVDGFLTLVYDFGSGTDAPSCSTAGRATWRASR